MPIAELQAGTIRAAPKCRGRSFAGQCSTPLVRPTPLFTFRPLLKTMSQSLEHQFQDRVAIVTGSTKGIGHAVAEELFRRGARVVVNGRDETRVQQTIAEFREQGYAVAGLAGDISDPAFCRRLAEHAVQTFGRIDVLVNNAGISMEGELQNLAPEVIDQVMQVNLLGAIYMTQAALPALRRSRGSILFISSAAAFFGLPRYAIYSASKMALTAIVDALRIELQRTGIHVGIAYPGFTQNDPRKQILNERGEWVPQPARDFVRPQPREWVAAQLVNMIAHRRRMRVFSGLGKLAWITSRISPRLVEWFLRRDYRRRYPEKQREWQRLVQSATRSTNRPTGSSRGPAADR